MTNAEKFRNVFGLYATELWAMPEEEFTEWLNEESQPYKNEDYNSMVRELLELEESMKYFYLTSTERSAFQSYIEERLGDV